MTNLDIFNPHKVRGIFEGLESEIATLRSRVKELEENLDKNVCGWCRWTTTKADLEGLVNHLSECQKNPISKLFPLQEEIKELKAKISASEAGAAGLKEENRRLKGELK